MKNNLKTFERMAPKSHFFTVILTTQNNNKFEFLRQAEQSHQIWQKILSEFDLIDIKQITILPAAKSLQDPIKFEFSKNYYIPVTDGK